MADFGNTGTITIRKSEPGAKVRVSDGEYLAYKVTVEGGFPIFTFACTHRHRFAANQFAGHPKQVYEWTWSHESPNPPGIPNETSDGSDDTYVVVLQFAAAIKYTLLVEHRDRNDAVIQTLKDIDFECLDAEEEFPEGLRVFVA